MNSYVAYSQADRVARITLVDGDRGNPIHAAQLSELRAAVTRAVRDEARVILLAATGRFFCVGGDLAAMASQPDMSSYVEELAGSLQQVIGDLTRSTALVVAAVQGPAAGAGFPLAAAADILLAGRAARFTLGHTKVGLSVDGGASLLVHTLGLHRVLRLALLNDELDAQEALAAGLVSRVFEDAELAEEAGRLAASLASGPALALAATKRLIRDVADPTPEAALRSETISVGRQAAEPDGREGVRAFVAKRSPRFGGGA